jgi:hypothetical protein
LLLRSLLIPPRFAYLEIDGNNVRVRMSYAFRSRFSRGDISGVGTHRPVVSIGVHGWRGRWMVNGAHRPIARITFALPVTARVLGVAVQVRELLVSVDDVAELQRALLT